MATTTVTVRLPAKTKAKLEKLAALSRRTKSWHAAEAIEAYVAREMPIVEGVVKAMAQTRARQVHSAADVMAETKALIAAAKAKQKKRV